MATIEQFVKYLSKCSNSLMTSDGKMVDVFDFNYEYNDEILSLWAKHFRNHYCLDNQIDILRNGTGLSRKEYLEQLKFPDIKEAPGPSIRSGDFAEILVADYVEFMLNFSVPRTRYIDKTIRNESTKGVDVIGYKRLGKKDNINDTLISVETKAKFSSGNSKEKLQEAVSHSAKDPVRKAESLNAIKQRLLFFNLPDEVDNISRFQNQTDRPYKYISGAVAFVCKENYNDKIITECTVDGHPDKANIILIVIKGNDMMNLVNHLYERAANEA